MKVQKKWNSKNGVKTAQRPWFKELWASIKKSAFLLYFDLKKIKKKWTKKLRCEPLKVQKCPFLRKLRLFFLMRSKSECKNWIYYGISERTKMKKSWSKNGILAPESWKKWNSKNGVKTAQKPSFKEFRANL